MDRRRQTHRAVEDHAAGAGDDPVGRPHRAAALRRCARPSRAWSQERHAPRIAARPYRHGGQWPCPRALLDAADRLAEGALMEGKERSFDWRVPAVWAALLAVSLVAHAHVEVTNEASRGNPISFGHALGVEGSSHLVIAALLPILYWLHRRWPIMEGWRNVLVHVLALVPFSIAHTLGIAALRPMWFAGILGERYVFPLTLDRLTYEFAKDIVNYAMLSAAVVAMRYLMQHAAGAAPAAAVAGGALPERFAVRQRGGSEVMVEVAGIDWIGAACHY